MVHDDKPFKVTHTGGKNQGPAAPGVCWRSAGVFVASLVLILGFGSAEQQTQLEREESARLRASCQNNLKQIGIVFKMFATESPATLSRGLMTGAAT